MFYALILGAFVVSGGVAMLCLAGAALAGASSVAHMSADDAMTLLHIAGALGAAAMAFWAPRSRIRGLAERFKQRRGLGRILGSLLVAYALTWTGYLIERAVDEHAHAPSLATLLTAFATASAIFVFDWTRDRTRRPSPPKSLV